MDLRLVEWLMGKLRFRWRRLISSQQEQCTLLSKVVQPHGFSHWAHLPCAPGYLSLWSISVITVGSLDCWASLSSGL